MARRSVVLLLLIFLLFIYTEREFRNDIMQFLGLVIALV